MSLIQTLPESILSNQQVNVDGMIDHVASMIGSRVGTVTRSRALGFLDRAAARLNMSGSFLFGQKVLELDGFTEGDNEFDLPTDWAWPTDAAWALGENDTKIRRLEWKLYDIFNTTQRDPTQTGLPGYVTYKDGNVLSGKVLVSPAVAPDVVTKLTLPYFSRIDRPSQVAEMAILPEVEEAMITMAETLAIRWRHLKQPALWQTAMKDADRMVEGARAASNRWLTTTRLAAVVDETGYLTTFTLDGYGNSAISVGPAYIQIGGV